jgi:transcriptional regulator with XRE-family HTH domain
MFVNCNPGRDWRSWDGKRVYCTIHGKVFSNESYCPLHASMKKPEGRVNIKPLPYILTDRQKQVLNLHKKGLSLKKIAEKLQLSKGTIQEHLKKALNPKRDTLTPLPSCLDVRLHNDEFKVSVEAFYDLFPGIPKLVGRNLEYKLLKTDNCHIKLHRNGKTLTVRFLSDIRGKSEGEVALLADERLKLWLVGFNMPGIQLLKEAKLINRHYGLLGTSFAKKVTDERKLLVVRDLLDSSIRLRIDLSAGAEIDAEHTEKGKDDMKESREYFQDLIDNPHYKPSDVRYSIDGLIKNQLMYAENMKSHVEAVQALAKGVAELVKVVKKLKKV